MAVVEPFGLSRILAAREKVRVDHVDVEVSGAACNTGYTGNVLDAVSGSEAHNGEVAE